MSRVKGVVIDKAAATRIATSLGWEPKREWVGLTDEEIEQEFGFIDEMLRDYAYRIEAKLKKKNSP